MWLRNVLVGSVITWGFIFAVMALSGCGAKFDMWGAKVAIPDGIDLHIGMNNISQVDDRRGLHATKSAEKY